MQILCLPERQIVMTNRSEVFALFCHICGKQHSIVGSSCHLKWKLFCIYLCVLTIYPVTRIREYSLQIGCNRTQYGSDRRIIQPEKICVFHSAIATLVKDQRSHQASTSNMDTLANHNLVCIPQSPTIWNYPSTRDRWSQRKQRPVRKLGQSRVLLT